jgi:hypothetical protein
MTIRIVHPDDDLLKSSPSCTQSERMPYYGCPGSINYANCKQCYKPFGGTRVWSKKIDGFICESCVSPLNKCAICDSVFRESDSKYWGDVPDEYICSTCHNNPDIIKTYLHMNPPFWRMCP